MALHQLSLKEIDKLDGGKPSLAFDGHLKRLAADCFDRPGDVKARRLTMTIELVPVIEPDGDCSEVKATVKFKSSVPDHKTKPLSLGLRRGGGLVFSEHCPDNVFQESILDADEAE